MTDGHINKALLWVMQRKTVTAMNVYLAFLQLYTNGAHMSEVLYFSNAWFTVMRMKHASIDAADRVRDYRQGGTGGQYTLQPQWKVRQQHDRAVRTIHTN